jgi:hypothetical protein
MMAIEAALPAGPIDEGDKNQPVKYQLRTAQSSNQKNCPINLPVKVPQIHLHTPWEVDLRAAWDVT